MKDKRTIEKEKFLHFTSIGTKKSIVKSFLMYMIQLEMEIIIGFLLHYVLMAFFLSHSIHFLLIFLNGKMRAKVINT